MGFFSWFDKGKKKARLAIFATALSFSVACSDMAKKADVKLKETPVLMMLNNSASKAHKILEKAKDNIEFGTLKDIQESIAEMDSLNKEFNDFFYSHEIDEKKLKDQGFTDDEIILIVGYKNNFVNARQELGLIEHDMENKK